MSVVAEPSGAPAGPSADADVLRVEHVSASYGPYRALFDVSFRVPAGGVVALVGSNGAGKSTVARTVTAVGALETATDRSSQLGHRMTDSMAAARGAFVGGVDESTPLPATRATTSTTPSTVHRGNRWDLMRPMPGPGR